MQKHNLVLKKYKNPHFDRLSASPTRKRDSPLLRGIKGDLPFFQVIGNSINNFFPFQNFIKGIAFNVNQIIQKSPLVPHFDKLNASLYKGGNSKGSSGIFLKTTPAVNPPSLSRRGLGGGIVFLLLSIFLFSFFLNSCQDSYGTDPYTKKVPIDPKDTTKHE